MGPVGVGVNLTRPLAAVDCETSGTSFEVDRILTIAIITRYPDGTRSRQEFRMDPGIPIPAEATAIHGITDLDCAGCPSFRELAPSIVQALEGCDLAGYNLKRFDLKMIDAELVRAELPPLDMTGRRVVDAYRLFQIKEPRDLSAAVRFYLGNDAANQFAGHDAMVDASVTMDVLDAQLERYPDLPQDVGALADICDDVRSDYVDRDGRLRLRDGEVVLGFGKYQGRSLEWIAKEDPRDLQWMFVGNFSQEVLDRVGSVMRDHGIDPWIDPDGKLVDHHGEAVVNFGKQKGMSLRQLAATDRGFLQWVLDKDFSEAVKALVAAALRGEFPERTT